MVDKLIGALAESIESAFDGKYKVYTESVYQNAQKPCFFAECERAERLPMLNRRFFVRVHVLITFENDGDEKKFETESIVARLFDILGLVKVEDGYLNGRKIYGKQEEGRFVVRAIYDMWPQNIEKDIGIMESLEIKEIYDGEERIYESGD